MDVLSRIEQLRMERGWSVNYLAMEAGLTQSTVNNLFSRHAEPKLSTLRALCEAFGITLAEFFAEESGEDDELIRKVRSLTPANKEALLVLLNTMK